MTNEEAIKWLQQLRGCSNLNEVYVEPIKTAITALSTPTSEELQREFEWLEYDLRQNQDDFNNLHDREAFNDHCFTIEKMLKSIRQMRSESCEWISVKDRLPERNVEVVAIDDCDNVGIFYIGRITGEWFTHGIIKIAPITHWIPLGRPLKGE